MAPIRASALHNRVSVGRGHFSVVAVLAVAGLWAAPAALAGTASFSGGELRYVGGAERNAVTISQPSAGVVRVRDTGAPVTPGTGCARVDANTADCAVRPSHVAVATRGGDDRVVVDAALPARIDGGDGNDRLAGGPLNDAIAGGPGRDQLGGREGNDTLEGGDDRDRLRGGPGDDIELGGADTDVFHQGDAPDGADRLDGGPGVDRVNYLQRTGAVTVTLDRSANDGDRAAGEGDDVRTEDVFGGAGNDELVGDSAANHLRGDGSNDSLDGGRGTDVLEGGPGGDSIISRDRSADRVSCGEGHDSVGADTRDVPSADCERFRTTASMRVSGPQAPLTRSGLMRVRVSCPSSAFGRCTGKVAVTTAGRVRTRSGVRTVRLGARRFRLDPGETREVAIRFRSSALRFLRRERRLTARVSLEGARDSAGASRRSSRRSKLRAPR